MGKKYEEARKKMDPSKEYSLEEAIALLKDIAFARFDETVEMAINLGVDPRKSDQMVRGSVVLPHGLGKKIRVLVFAKGEKAKEAEMAGADYVGAEDLIEKIQGGWLEFDRAIATPDLMGMVGRLGRILGPRGLMPNPKTGTVTFELERAIREASAGKIDYRTEKAGIVHVPIGKISFDTHKLIDNARAVIDSVMKAKPHSSKGRYLKKIHISSTMGVGVPIDISSLT